MTFSSKNLSVDLRPSLLLGTLVVSVHILALVTLVVNGRFSVLLSMFVGLAILISFVYTMDRSVLLTNSKAVRSLRYHDGNWRLMLTSGEILDAEIRFPVYVSSLFIVVHFRTLTDQFSVVMARDAIAPDDYRRSKVFFRYALAGLAE